MAKADGQNITGDGFCIFSMENTPFTLTEWMRLRELCLGNKAQFELVKCGDTSEPTSVLVKRLLRDGNPPEAYDGAGTQEILAIIATQAKLGFLERVIGRTGLMIRRAQAHILEEGGYIARHRDSDSSEHYVAAVVLLLDRAAEGGEFVVSPDDVDSRTLPDFSMLVTDAGLPHEVTPVVRGQRCSLAFWLADVSSP